MNVETFTSLLPESVANSRLTPVSHDTGPVVGVKSFDTSFDQTDYFRLSCLEGQLQLRGPDVCGVLAEQGPERLHKLRFGEGERDLFYEAEP